MRQRRSGLLGLWVLVVLAGVSPAAHAAEATNVLDAIDGDNLFDLNIELTYRGQAKTAKITREDARGGRQLDVTEFQYFEHKHEVIPRLRVGIFQDIELFVALPYTVWEQRTGWQHYRNPANRDPRRRGYSTFLRDQCMYGSATDPLTRRPRACDTGETAYPNGRSTLSGDQGSWPVNNELDWPSGDGRPTPSGYNGRDTDWDFDQGSNDPYVPQFNSIRGAVAYSVENGIYFFPTGLGDAELGIAFSPFSIARFNDQRESAMPTMRIELKYQVPSGPIDTPEPYYNRSIHGPREKFPRSPLGGTATNFQPGGTGSGLHRFNAAFAMSKRMKLFDPFMAADYQLGVPQYYLRDAPERSWLDPLFYTHQVGGQIGVELVPLYYVPDVEEVVNLRFIGAVSGRYIARHRGPSEMSDVLNKWTLVDDYLQLMGRVGLVLAVPFVSFRAMVEAGHETPHLLTGESRSTTRDVTSPTKSEYNVHYNPVLDQPGRRVKVTETAVVRGNLTLAITF